MNIGIVGTGGIVHMCLEALEEINNIRVTAIWTREQELDTAKELANKYNIDKIYTNYEEMLCDDDIDFVYLGIINNMHYEFAKKALEFKKNVIGEKPFTSTYKEALELQELATKSKLYIFEAITLMYSPNYQYIKRRLREIGNVKLIQSNYSQYSSRYSKYLEGVVLPAFNPELSGGALYDINIYNIHFVLGLFGKPDEVDYFANKGFNGIDTSGIAVLRYDDFVAQCTGAKDSNSPSYAIIQGEKGYIKVNSATNACVNIELCVDGVIETFNENLYSNRMVNEFLAFEEIFSTKDLGKCYTNLQHSVDVMDVVTAARQKVGIKFPADVK